MFLKEVYNVFVSQENRKANDVEIKKNLRHVFKRQ